MKKLKLMPRNSNMLTTSTVDRASSISFKEPADQLRVLAIDDDRAQSSLISQGLKSHGCLVNIATNPDVAIAYLRDQSYDIVFCDSNVDKHDKRSLLSSLLAIKPKLHIVMMAAIASPENIVLAMRSGANDFVIKPFHADRIASFVAQARERRNFSTSYHASADGQHGCQSSESPAMRTAIETISLAARSDVPVLLRGENGTGKSMFAKALLHGSARSDRPFVTVNCPSLSDELMTSELFGHVKGSFTGAIADQKGKIEAAENGTIFLDEVGDLTSTVQGKLLRFLQDQRYERLGDTKTRQANVRVVAATNKNLELLVSEGRFREDLLYRLNAIEIILPSLRDRQADIINLASAILAEISTSSSECPKSLSPAARDLMIAYPWPGNVRELRNELLRITVLWPAEIIEPDAFSPRMRGKVESTPVIGGDCTIASMEAEHIRRVLARSNSFDASARILGIQPSTLWRKRVQLGM